MLLSALTILTFIQCFRKSSLQGDVCFNSDCVFGVFSHHLFVVVSPEEELVRVL